MADYTYEQLTEAAKNAHAAGNADAAKKLLEAALPLRPSGDAPTPAPTPSPVADVQKSGVDRALDITGEVVAGLNRPMTSLIDFATTPVRALEQQVRPYAQSMLGIEPDTAAEPFSLRGMVPERGEFAGEGVTTDIAAGTGELTGMVMSGAPVQRFFTQMIAKGLQTGTAKNVFELLGSGKSIDDIIFGISGGLGGESAAALAGQAEFLPEGAEEFARLSGQIITPAAAQSLLKQVTNFATNRLLNEAIPSTEALKGASSYIYNQLDELGVKAGKESTQRLSSNLSKFLDDEITNDPMYGTVRNRVTKLLEEIKSGDVTFGTIDTARGKLAEQAAAGTDDIARTAGIAAKLIDEEILRMTGSAPSQTVDGRTIAEAVKTARELWRRSNTSKQLDKVSRNAAIDAQSNRDAKNPKAYEQYLRKGMAALLKSDKKTMSFTKAEEEAINAFVKGGKLENVLMTIGNLGAKTGVIASGLVTGAIGTFAYATANPSLVTPIAIGAGTAAGSYLVGRGLQQLSLAALKSNGNLMKGMIRAGNDAEAIARSYVSNTPSGKRDARVLSALLMRNNADLSSLRGTAFGDSSLGQSTFAYYDLFNKAVTEERQAEQEMLQAQMPNQVYSGGGDIKRIAQIY